MSIDIAKYPTLALVETPDDLRLLPKRVYRNSAMNCGNIC